MSIQRRIYYSLSPEARFFVRRLYYGPLDFWESVSGSRDKRYPPRGMIFTGPGDFKQIGLHYLDLFKTECHLQPDHSVLDIGSGIGRIAIPLTEYLSAQGRYEGIDIVERGVRWCQENISTRYPHFQFRFVPLKNDLYNLSTDEQAKNFHFPYGNDEFDLVVLTSVFTHMMPEDMENYHQEIARMLKPGGRCLATYFIINEESRSLMKAGNHFQFQHSMGHYHLLDARVKEANIAFEEDYLFRQIQESGLSVEKKIWGYWSGREKSHPYNFQDTLILMKS